MTADDVITADDVMTVPSRPDSSTQQSRIFPSIFLSAAAAGAAAAAAAAAAVDKYYHGY